MYKLSPFLMDDKVPITGAGERCHHACSLREPESQRETHCFPDGSFVNGSLVVSLHCSDCLVTSSGSLIYNHWQRHTQTPKPSETQGITPGCSFLSSSGLSFSVTAVCQPLSPPTLLERTLLETVIPRVIHVFI